MSNQPTKVMKNKILEKRLGTEDCSTSKEFDNFLKKNEKEFRNWKSWLNYFISSKHKNTSWLTPELISKDYNEKKTTKDIYRILDIKPKKREYVISFAMTLRCTVKETNQILSYCGFAGLYSRCVEDAVYIYLINANLLLPFGERSAYHKAESLLHESIAILNNDEKSTDNFSIPKGTIEANKVLDGCFSMEDFRNYLLKFRDLHRNIGKRVAEHLESYTSGNLKEALLLQSVGKEWSTLSVTVSKWKAGTALVRRHQLLGIAICLGMNEHETNKLLETAGMGSLYAGDINEAALIWMISNYSSYQNRLKLIAKFDLPGCYIQELDDITSLAEFVQLFYEQSDIVNIQNTYAQYFKTKKS